MQPLGPAALVRQAKAREGQRGQWQQWNQESRRCHLMILDVVMSCTVSVSFMVLVMFLGAVHHVSLVLFFAHIN